MLHNCIVTAAAVHRNKACFMKVIKCVTLLHPLLIADYISSPVLAMESKSIQYHWGGTRGEYKYIFVGNKTAVDWEK